MIDFYKGELPSKPISPWSQSLIEYSQISRFLPILSGKGFLFLPIFTGRRNACRLCTALRPVSRQMPGRLSHSNFSITMQRIFITHIAPRDKALKFNLSVAACNFSHNLIAGGMFDKVYSILPPFVAGRVEAFPGLVYSSLRNNRLLGRLAPVVENLKVFRHIPRGASVWYYNCTFLNAPLIVLLRLFKPSVKQQMIILDYTPSRNPVDRFFLWLTNHMHGTIRLADSPLFTVKNSVCLPGVVPPDSPQYPEVTEMKTEFLISGALGDNIAMLPMLLEAFSQLPTLTLHITGKTPDPAKVEQYAKRCRNIVYHGMVEYDEYLRILHRTPFLLSTRNPEAPENQCNFPSKIIEALLHNRIIVSTIHYPQLEGIRYFEVGADLASFLKDIRKVAALSAPELLPYANQGEAVRRRFGVDVWKKAMEKIENNPNN